MRYRLLGKSGLRVSACSRVTDNPEVIYFDGKDWLRGELAPIVDFSWPRRRLFGQVTTRAFPGTNQELAALDK
jgi:hypothetical protein